MKKIVAILLIFILILSGCQAQKESYSGFRLYYMSEDGKTLLDTGCKIEALETTTDWLEEMMGTLNNGVDVPTSGQPLLPEGAKILKAESNSGIVSLDLEKGYYDLPISTQVIIRAGLTKAFTQSSGVKAVSFRVDGKPAVDASGNELPTMTAKMFVDENSDGINNFRSSAMTLYFTDKEGTKLIPENRTAFYSVNTPIELAVINELISGPSQSGHYRTLPADLTVLSVTIQDEICYVNFDESWSNTVFLMAPEIQIYSMVNSIAAVCNVENVVFTINGSNSVIFKGTVDLEQIFSPINNLEFN